MWLEAIITRDDLVAALEKFLPVKIFLEKEGEEDRKERFLWLSPATKVELVPGQGARVTCPAEISWSIAGMNPTMEIDELRVLISPRVVETGGRQVLELVFEVEEADFHSLPDIVDATIATAINASLAKKPLSWNFSGTLTRRVSLGSTFEQIQALDLRVVEGRRDIGADALALVISLDLDFARTD